MMERNPQQRIEVPKYLVRTNFGTDNFMDDRYSQQRLRRLTVVSSAVALYSNNDSTMDCLFA